MKNHIDEETCLAKALELLSHFLLLFTVWEFDLASSQLKSRRIYQSTRTPKTRIAPYSWRTGILGLELE